MTAYSHSAGVPTLDDSALQRILRRTKYAHLTEDQFELLIVVCQKKGLDPWLSHVYATTRPAHGRSELIVLATIEGLRELAASTKEYGHQLGPFWCGIDRKWRRGWVEKEPPVLARVGVVKKGQSMAFWGVAKWEEAAIKSFGPDGKSVLDEAWARMPSFMLAKVAEAMALRKAFPSKIGGLYIPGEIPLNTGSSPKTRAVPDEREVDEGAPTSDFLFQMRLVRDFEIVNVAERSRVIDDFKTRYADMYATDRRGWYSAVLHDLQQSKDAAGNGSA